MKNSYSDIRKLIAIEPTWFDEHGVPRYCTFTPRETANIYCDTALLVAVACQSCGREFKVCLSQDRYDRAGHEPELPLAEGVRTRQLGYGDPPNVGCCNAGPTMTSVPLRVIEFWIQNPKHWRSPGYGWDRKPELEVEITPDWWTGRGDEL